MISPRPGINHLVDISFGWLVTLGVVMLVLGSLAIIFPAVTSVSMTVLFGILLLVGGAVRLVSMFHNESVGDFFLKVLGAAIYIIAGVLLLVYPLTATVTLTLILGFYFIAQGVASLVISAANYGKKSWGWMLFNGLVSLALGILIWASLPSSAAWAIGLLVGIGLIIDGWAIIMAAWMKRSMERMAPA